MSFMKMKQYIQPIATVLHVNTCEVICGSGNDSESLYNNTPSNWSNGFPIGGDAAIKRDEWREYEDPS